MTESAALGGRLERGLRHLFAWTKIYAFDVLSYFIFADTFHCGSMFFVYFHVYSSFYLVLLRKAVSTPKNAINCISVWNFNRIRNPSSHSVPLSG